MQKVGKGPKGFIVVLPGGIIEIPQDSYLSWLTLFYLLPRVFVRTPGLNDTLTVGGPTP